MGRIAALSGVAGMALLLAATSALAHFGTIIPSTDNVGKDDKKAVALTIQFVHPFEGAPLMKMDKPSKFGVLPGDKVTDLPGTLEGKESGAGRCHLG